MNTFILPRIPTRPFAGAASVLLQKPRTSAALAVQDKNLGQYKLLGVEV